MQCKLTSEEAYHSNISVADRQVVRPDLSQSAVEITALLVQAIVFCLPHCRVGQPAEIQQLVHPA